MRNWYNHSVEETIKWLASSKKGLSETEVKIRFKKYGENKLKEKEKESLFKLLLNQFTDFLVIILIFAALISFWLGFISGDESNFLDGGLILAIVVANGVLGFFQEYNAEKSLEALKKLSSINSRVIREGITKVIPTTDLVPGDIILLESGDKVGADARIIECFDLKSNESMLTGESLPVKKNFEALEKQTPLAERNNMLYMNTFISFGKALAIVTATGMETEVGKIAKQIMTSEKQETTFQRQVKKLGKTIGVGVLAIIGIVAAVEFFLGVANIVDIFFRSVSLAVAAVPEGLPAVVTVSLMIGAANIARKKALARKLPVIEMLGAVSVICTDKTGTLTENKMSVVKYYLYGKEKKIDESNTNNEMEKELFLNGVFCNDAQLGKEEGEYIGDPTEIALFESARKKGFNIKKLLAENKKIEEKPFSSERKMMSVALEVAKKKIVYAKGAPEVLIEKCSKLQTEKGIIKMTDSIKKELIEKNENLAKEAMRVIGFGFKEYKKGEVLEENLVFLGLQAMIDPPRKEVKKAIADCRTAGIKVVMVTGDNPITAVAIGKQLGFTSNQAFTGNELDKMSDEELTEIVRNNDIFARAVPSHKVRILKLFQNQGEIVAMTGDGVNDAPALKSADVGVAMGIRGTDVSREASDLVLLDDNFTTIRDSVEEGRGIFDNIRKFVSYLLSANFGEVLIVFIYTILEVAFFHALTGKPILLASQLLWLNLLTDGFPAVALGLDRPADNVMDRKPLAKGEGVINKRLMITIFSTGIILAAVLLAMFFYFYSLTNDFEKSRTILFTALVLTELIRVQIVRVTFAQKIFTNKWLWIALAFSTIMQLIILYTPLSELFKLVPLGIGDWMFIGVGLVIFGLLSFVYIKLDSIYLSKRKQLH